MSARTITVTLPETVYAQLQATARASAQSVDSIVAQSLARSIPPHVAALLPGALRAELDVMEHLSDHALRAIALSVAPPERGPLMDTLIDLKQDGTISPVQQEQLTALSIDSESLMVRKAHAFALLTSRGHALPDRNTLPRPTP